MLADAGEVPGGTRSNERFLATRVRWPEQLPAARQVLLCDAQTSGGLLMALPANDVEPLLAAPLDSFRIQRLGNERLELLGGIHC